MNENLQSFLQKASADNELQKKMQSAASAEDAYKIASEFSGGYSYEEFVEGMKKVNEALTSANSRELSDEDLAIVAGGKSEDKMWDRVTTTASVATAAASAAATAAS